MTAIPADLTGVFTSLLELVLVLLPLLVLQRGLHREVQMIFLLLTRRLDLALALFSVLFFPGVLLHEGSHFVMAHMLGVRTGRFSLLPHPMENGRLRLGYVETAQADWVRDTLIGAAPLLAGGAFVAYAGLMQLGFSQLWALLLAEGPLPMLQHLSTLYTRPDFWLWFYLVFTVSSTMLPSPSDRRAWGPLALVLALLLVGVLLAGAGPWLLMNLGLPLQRAIMGVVVVFGISAFIHAVLLAPLWLVRKLLNRLTGLEVRAADGT